MRAQRKSAALFAVEVDREGICLAALEMLKESLYSEERERTLRAAKQMADPQEALESAGKRQFALAYYLWVGYLFSLEAEVAAGIHGTLTAADVVGLLALRQARARFESEHPPCRCGRRLKNEAEKLRGSCVECWAKEK
jgi:hypothetical protein